MDKELCCYGEYESLNERCKVCEDEAWCELETKYKKGKENEEQDK